MKVAGSFFSVAFSFFFTNIGDLLVVLQLSIVPPPTVQIRKKEARFGFFVFFDLSRFVISGPLASSTSHLVSREWRPPVTLTTFCCSLFFGAPKKRHTILSLYLTHTCIFLASTFLDATRPWFNLAQGSRPRRSRRVAAWTYHYHSHHKLFIERKKKA